MLKDELRLPYYIGQTVYVQGYSFVVCDIWTEAGPMGRALYRWRGVCNEDKRNDSIRHTSFNGAKAIYGGLLQCSCGLARESTCVTLHHG